ncbi:hypothetical protein CEE37_08240 [candidate division LCP-89 bacterium B3_LCP]|uniref:Major facilitator superfamily (MFS) profile domain-containing protein n=1 Tax=candidate division LCP-89 bacterium B3_LCP TaxID=2012998 RepID=A0A532UZB5_UNCL8|nr:MAG: hypothetical protein CEE37_08240 [candidate division LCP-89 bacterium B3_LCP]
MHRIRFLIHSLAHLVNDSYGGFLAPLLPLLAARHELSLVTTGFLVTIVTLSASLAQPFWGWLSDRHPHRGYIVGGVFASGLFFSMIGIAPNLVVLVIVIIAGGLGISCFHPMATAVASDMTVRRKGLAIAFFVTAGTSGFALGPVFVALLVETVGLHWMPIAAVPALLVAVIWLLFGPRGISGTNKTDSVGTLQNSAPAIPYSPIILLTSSSILRGVCILIFTNFMSFHLETMGLSLKSYSFYIFALQFGGSMGVLVCGSLSDKIGRWRVMLWTPVVSTPLFYLFLRTEGTLSFIALFLAGFFIFASAPAVIVAAQKMMFRREAMASALQIGLAWGTAGLLMGPVGKLGEVIGVYNLLLATALVPILLSVMTLLITPFRNQLEA